jgi:DNA topoisomerase IB
MDQRQSARPHSSDRPGCPGTQTIPLPEFRATRESAKFQHLAAFAEALPRIRARVTADMALPELPREKVVATIVDLL